MEFKYYIDSLGTIYETGSGKIWFLRYRDKRAGVSIATGCLFTIAPDAVEISRVTHPECIQRLRIAKALGEMDLSLYHLKNTIDTLENII